MGPRLFSRGNVHDSHSDSKKALMLQWGRGFSAAETVCSVHTDATDGTGFNGAAAFQPRKPRASAERQSWGPPASMGPRLFSRGNGHTLGQWQPRRRASMGPRLFSRGNLDCRNKSATIPRTLQWGRGFSAAETPTLAASTLSLAPTLQWGRGFSAAETRNLRHRGRGD